VLRGGPASRHERVGFGFIADVGENSKIDY